MRFPNRTAWTPGTRQIADAALTRLAHHMGLDNYDALLAASIATPERYWTHVMADLGITWQHPHHTFCSTQRGIEYPQWFVGARLNWVQIALRWAHDPKYASTPAVISEAEGGTVRSLSYIGLDVRVRRFAAGLRRLGISRGDRVGLMLAMSEEAVIALLAVAAIGAISVPLFTGFGVDAIWSRLALSRAKALISSAGFVRRGRFVDMSATLKEVAARLPSLTHLIVYGDRSAPEDSHSWDSVANGPMLEHIESMGPDDPLMIVYTSGTTGAPKGTVHTHAGFPLKIAHDAAYHFELRCGDRWLWPSDMGWVVGPITALGALSLGATLICYDGAPDMPDWSRLGHMIARHRVTHFGASPTLIRGLLAHEAAALSADPSSLRVLISAGEVLGPEAFDWFFHKFGRGVLPIINYTGGTEASGALLANVVVRPIKVSGFNTASPGVAAFVAGADGQRLRGEAGELAIGAPFVGMTRSFWEDDERYIDAYWTTLPKLWVHGDLVIEDADGDFYVLGRSDDTLKIAGKRVGPAEVEDVVLRETSVSEAVAVGLPDAIKGEALVVCVSPQESDHDSDTLACNVANAIESALGRPFRPTAVYCVPALPRTRNGKVMRRVVRRVLCGETPGDLSALEDPATLAPLQELLAPRKLPP